MTLRNLHGWRRDQPDPRDFPFMAVHRTPRPPVVDLRNQMPPVFDQGNLGSCTAQATCAAVQVDAMKQALTKPDTDTRLASRLFVYWNARALWRDENHDAGSTIRNNFKAMTKWGLCDEVTWPYDVRNGLKKPAPAAYAEALGRRKGSYFRLAHTQMQIQAALAEGLPVSFGMAIWDSFMTDEVEKTGIMPMPSPKDSIIGGHAMLLVGYDDTRQLYIVRNSWGEWGDKGYGYIPYGLVHDRDIASDFWVVRYAPA